MNSAQSGILNIFFAPTNDAFKAYAANAGTSVEELNSPNNAEALVQLLAKHIVKDGVWMTADLGKLESWGDGDKKIFVAVIDGKVVIDRDINMLVADNVVGNGVIHVIDGVIIGKAPAATEAPACTSDTQDIMCALESDPEFSTLVALLKTASFAGELKAAGPFTFFAPTNDAFEAYAAKNGTSVEELISPNNVEALQQLLTFHFIPDNPPMAELESFTVGDRKIKIFVAVIDGKVVVDRDINVLYADNVVGNGVIHVIDGVIIGKE